MTVGFQVFRGSFATWSSLFNQAADFAETVGQDRVINISHSCGPNHEGVVTVWYWTDERQP